MTGLVLRLPEPAQAEWKGRGGRSAGGDTHWDLQVSKEAR